MRTNPVIHVAEVTIADAPHWIVYSVDAAGTLRPSWVACADPVGAAAYAALIESGEELEDLEAFHAALERHCQAEDCPGGHRFIRLAAEQVLQLAAQLTRAGRDRAN